MRRSLSLWEIQRGSAVGRQRLAQQFATMEGWQRHDSQRFDDFVAARRQSRYFDAFDQRVERAFRLAAQQHKTEVTNGFKRRAKTSGDRWTAAVVMEVRRAVEERLRWLRDVWAQIDADYRSSDPARQKKAADEVSAALKGDPGAYMEWMYQQKRENTFAGPKQQERDAAELEAAELPEVTQEEANRYHNLKLRMIDIERSVKSRFGIAGQQHWAMLQAAKDDAYDVKLDEAAKVYEQLLDQTNRYDESRRTALLRSNVERVHQAQVRFKAAMELERERERLIEAHEAMRMERQEEKKKQRVAALQEAAEQRRSGATSEEVQRYAREKLLERHARQDAENQVREREEIVLKKNQYLDLIDQFRSGVEAREGEELLGSNRHLAAAAFDSAVEHPQLQRQRKGPSPAPSPNAFGFMDAEQDGDSLATSASLGGNHASLSGSLTETAALTRPSANEVASSEQKRQLWKAINADTYEDPFHTIHQARLDAAHSYDPLYAKHFPLSIMQGRKNSKQNMGEFAAGGGSDGQVLKAGYKEHLNYMWGMSSATIHDLDSDGSVDYMMTGNWHVRNPKTGDIDWRYERKKGGAAFRGPALYEIGARREAKDPSNETVDPSAFSPRMRHDRTSKASAAGTRRSSSARRSGGSSVKWRSS